MGAGVPLGVVVIVIFVVIVIVVAAKSTEATVVTVVVEAIKLADLVATALGNGRRGQNHGESEEGKGSLHFVREGA